MYSRLDTFLDRPLAAAAAMAFTLCALTALIVWHRVLIVRPHMWHKTTAAPLSPTMDRPDTKSLVLATGVAFVALAELFGMIALGKLGVIRWSTFVADVIFLQVYVCVIAAALVSVRAATYAVCGNHALAIFGGVSMLAGAVVFYLGG